MKRIITLLLALGLAFQGLSAPADTELTQVVAKIRSEIDEAACELKQAAQELFEESAEAFEPERQSSEEINAAAREQVIRELDLSKKQREKFGPLYKAYREALDRAVDADAAVVRSADDASQQRALKAKLANIAATARVKHDYVDKFAEILSAEQIRRLYNIEGQIGATIKRASTAKRAEKLTLYKQGREVTRDWGAAGDYTEIEISNHMVVTVSPVAETISVTTDERLIDYIAVECDNGVLRFRQNVQTLNIKMNDFHGIQIVVPASSSLHSLSAGAFSHITCLAPLRSESVSIRVSSYGHVSADIDVAKTATLKIGSYGRFRGEIRCDKCDLNVSSFGSAEGPIVCRKQGTVSVESYARFANAISAPSLSIEVGSGSSMNAAIKSDFLTLTASSYGKVSGSIESGQAKLSVGSAASLNCDFSGNALDVSVGSYAKVALRSSATVANATVCVSGSGSYKAPLLEVADYDLSVSSDSKANVWCSGRLKIKASGSAQVTYDGPCTVETTTSNIRRR